MSETLPTPTSQTFADHRAALTRLDVDGGRIAYLDLGPSDAHPVLLLHGIPTSSWIYRAIAPQIAGAGLRAVAPDMLGFGASDKPVERSAYTLARQAGRLVALLDHLELERVTLVMHDAGGPWGLELLDGHPDRVAGLVVLNTTAYPDAFTPPRDILALAGPLGPAMLGMMRSPLGRSMVHRMISGLTHAGAGLDAWVTRPHWQALREGGTAALRAFSQDMNDALAQMPRYAEALRRSAHLPSTLIWGTEDPVLRPERLVPRFTADLDLEPGNVHLLEHASHFLHEDRPADIARLIIEFVTTQVAPSRGAGRADQS